MVGDPEMRPGYLLPHERMSGKAVKLFLIPQLRAVCGVFAVPCFQPYSETGSPVVLP